jgi:hypothetical protein
MIFDKLDVRNDAMSAIGADFDPTRRLARLWIVLRGALQRRDRRMLSTRVLEVDLQRESRAGLVSDKSLRLGTWRPAWPSGTRSDARLLIRRTTFEVRPRADTESGMQTWFANRRTAASANDASRMADTVASCERKSARNLP